jgi:hypothetical protein
MNRPQIIVVGITISLTKFCAQFPPVGAAASREQAGAGSTAIETPLDSADKQVAESAAPHSRLAADLSGAPGIERTFAHLGTKKVSCSFYRRFIPRPDHVVTQFDAINGSCHHSAAWTP